MSRAVQKCKCNNAAYVKETAPQGGSSVEQWPNV
jgi:hypothetical protein